MYDFFFLPLCTMLIRLTFMGELAGDTKPSLWLLLFFYTNDLVVFFLLYYILILKAMYLLSITSEE